MKKIRFVKEYSINFQKMIIDVELDTNEDDDMVLTYMDTIGMREIEEMCSRVKASEHYAPQKNFTPKMEGKVDTTTKKDYTTNKKTYKKTHKATDFGSEKQWKMVRDDRNAEKLQDAGIDPEEISNYKELQKAVGVIMDNLNG